MMKIRNLAAVAFAIILALSLVAFAGCGSADSGESGEEAAQTVSQTEQSAARYTFRHEDNLQQHYKKHGIEMGFDSPESYLAAANAVIANPDSLTKEEKEDGDTVYYLEKSNEFVVLSTDGYIRTYFNPDDGIDYFNRQ